MLTEQFTTQLQTSLRGKLIQSQDADYDTSRKVYNGMFDRRPSMIARCADVADVIVAVNFDHSKSFIKIYPNPSSEFFTLDVTGGNEEILSLDIINDNGQLIKSLSNLSFPYRFGNDLKPGTWFVTVKKQTETLHFKIIKAK